jgi:hypothetical protein
MNYWNKICGFVLIFFLSALFSAAQTVKNSISFMSVNKQLKSSFAGCVSNNENNNSFMLRRYNIVNGNYYTQHFGVVCKKELALQKAIKVPLHIRLGSLQQCNYLEGKR